MMNFQAVQGMTYVDRGDPATGDFYFSGTGIIVPYSYIDLSSIIPINTKAVLLRTAFSHSVQNAVLFISKKGNSNLINGITCRAIASNQVLYYDGGVFVSSDRQLQYNIVPYGTYNVIITVAGWYI